MNNFDVDSMEYLNTVSMELASKCNLKCKMCSHPSNMREPSFMSVDQFKIIIDKLMPTKIRRLFFNMGEPLMNKNIFDMVTYAKERGFFVYISSNGMLLNERNIAGILESGVDALKISIEGCTPDVYENIRIGGNFDRLFRNVARMYDMKNRAHSPLYSWISTILMKGNEDMVEFTKFWGPYCDDIEYSSLSDHIGLVQDNKDISLTDNWDHRKTCPQIKPYKELNVLSNGDMVICCVDFHARCVLGNLVNEELETIWMSEKMKDIRTRAYSDNIPSIDPCGDCHICDYSNLLQDNVQSAGNLLHYMVKKKRWDTLNLVKYSAEADTSCSSCGNSMKINIDGICINCLKKEPFYGKYLGPKELKVMIVGDSFGMPRPFKMNNRIEMDYEYCYPEQLRRMLAEYYNGGEIMVINECKRANTSLGVLYAIKNPRFGEIYLSQPHYLVVQVGNVDCYERGKHHDEFAPFPEFRGKNPWVSCDDFITIIAQAIKEAFVAVPVLKAVILVNILPIEKEDNKKNIATRKRISLYNSKLKMFEKIPNIHVLDVYKLFYKSTADVLASDGIHPNKAGSKILADLIFEKIKEIQGTAIR